VNSDWCLTKLGGLEVVGSERVVWVGCTDGCLGVQMQRRNLVDGKEIIYLA
jgi:hypothetical protein